MRYSIKDLKMKAASGEPMTSKEIVCLGLHELAMAEKAINMAIVDQHINMANAYARLAQATKSS